jgi:O-antigen ligase
MWLLMLMIFSVPNRESPTGIGDLDLIAVAKLVARVVSIGLLMWVVWFASVSDQRRRLVFWAMTPFGLYVAFALASTLWSPLKGQSLGQAGGLLAIYLLAVALALTVDDQRRTERTLFHLVAALTFVSTVLLAADFVSHDFSGLNRDSGVEDGSFGLLHPTASGATASLGLVLLVACWLLWAWPWASRLLLPGIVVHVVILDLAASRTADGMALLVLVAMLLTLVPREWLGVVLLAGSTAVAVYLAIDPHLNVVETLVASGAGYASRGESAASISTLTGRTALWEKVWGEFLKSPLIGHGYFVSSATGELDVWSGPANRTAHNLVLQALVSTGVVGAGLLLWGLGRPARFVPLALRGGEHARSVAALALLVTLWFLGWTQLSESFLGPVRPESVVWFVTVGIVVGNLASLVEPRPPSAEARS